MSVTWLFGFFGSKGGVEINDKKRRGSWLGQRFSLSGLDHFRHGASLPVACVDRRHLRP